MFSYNLLEPENDTFLGSPSLPLSGRITRRSSLFFLLRACLQAQPSRSFRGDLRRARTEERPSFSRSAVHADHSSFPLFSFLQKPRISAAFRASSGTERRRFSVPASCSSVPGEGRQSKTYGLPLFFSGTKKALNCGVAVQGLAVLFSLAIQFFLLSLRARPGSTNLSFRGSTGVVGDISNYSYSTVAGGLGV